MTYHNKNYGKSPFDPDYDEACEEREQVRREK